MDELKLDIDFLLNDPEVRAAAERIKASIKDIGKTSDAEIARIVKNNIQDKEIREQIVLSLKAQKQAIIDLDNAEKQRKQTVDSSTKSSRQLNMSIAQISRELPAFTYSAQTGFMAIANNIPILTDEINRARAANAELVASGQKGVPIWKQLVSGLFSWQTALSVGLTVLTIYGKEIGEWIKSMFAGGEAARNAALKMEAVSKALDSTDYTNAIKQTTELKAAIEGTKDKLVTKERVVKLYNDTIGKTAGKLEEFNQVEQWQINHANEYVEMMFMKAKAQAMLQIAIEKNIEAQKKSTEGPDFMDYTKGFIRSMGAGPAGFGLMGTFADISNLESQAKLQGQSKTLISMYQKMQEDLQAYAKKHKLNIFGDTDTTGKPENLYSQILNGRKDVLDKLADLDAEYARKSFTKDQEEIQALKDKFTQFRRIIQEENAKIAKYNKTAAPGKKISLIDISQVDPIEQRADDDLRSKQAVERLKTDISAQKQLFEQFEQYKLEFGSEKASERYAQDLKGFKTYIDYLNSLMPKAGDNSARANALRDFLSKEIPKAQKEADDKAFDDNLKNLKRILEAAKTSATEINRINEQYDKDLATLRKNYSGEELAQREADLAKSHAKQLEGVRMMAFEETQIAQDMARNIFFMTEAELKAHVQKLKGILKADKQLASDDPNKLTPGQRRELEASYKNAKALSTESNITAENFERTANALAEIGGSLSALSSALAESNPGLSDTLNTMSQIAQVGSDAAGSVASFMTGDIIGGITKGIKTIAGVINIFKASKESARQAREEIEEFYATASAGEIEYQALLRQRARQQAEDNNKNLQGIKAQYDLLKKQSTDLAAQQSVLFSQLQGESFISGQSTKKYGGVLGISRKTKVVNSYSGLNGKSFDEIEQLYTQGKLTEGAKALFEQLQKLKDEGVDVAATLADIALKAQEIFTGTTADTLTDSLLQMFREGKTGVQDLADFFKDRMDDAALSIFKNKVLADAVDKFYTDFAAKAQSDEKLTQSEITELQTLFSQMTSDAAKKFEELKKITGLDLGGNSNSTNSLKGAIKSELTEETGSVLAGRLMGIQLAVVEANAIAKGHGQTMAQQQALLRDQLLSLVKIEQNTRRSADTSDTYLPYLRSIDAGIRDSLGYQLRAAGKYGY